MMIMVIMMLIAAEVVEGDRYYFESSDAVLLTIMGFDDVDKNPLEDDKDKYVHHDSDHCLFKRN